MNEERIDYCMEIAHLMEEGLTRVEAMAILALLYPHGEIRGER